MSNTTTIITLGDLLALSQQTRRGSTHGKCICCQRIVDDGHEPRRVFSGNFLGWNRLYAGDCICSSCSLLFRDEMRKHSWVAWSGGLEFFKNDEAHNILFNPPEPPFFVYIAKMGHKQAWLSCIYRVAGSRSKYFFAHEDSDAPILFERVRALEMSTDASTLIERGVSKTELRTHDYSVKTVQGAIQGGYVGLLRRTARYKNDPLWSVIVDVIRVRGKQNRGIIGDNIQQSTLE